MREAMKLMDELQQMEELERQLRRVQTPDDLEKIDPSTSRSSWVKSRRRTSSG